MRSANNRLVSRARGRNELWRTRRWREAQETGGARDCQTPSARRAGLICAASCGRTIHDALSTGANASPVGIETVESTRQMTQSAECGRAHPPDDSDSACTETLRSSRSSCASAHDATPGSASCQAASNSVKNRMTRSVPDRMLEFEERQTKSRYDSSSYTTKICRRSDRASFVTTGNAFPRFVGNRAAMRRSTVEA